ncbi:putative phage abortive infection protein [Pseudomonas brassicacearum]|uniref:putative phage abortive infection protein n=1 Tax=Pseudomonas brassicacearum TaxID=930166 RepID=UPI003D6C3659
MPIEKRLAAQYRKQLRKERINFILQKAWIHFHEKTSWMRFGPVFLAVSLLLIFCVGVVLWLKVSVGVDLPLLRIANTDQLASMGQIGDFFGGVLNPLLSFMALIAVLFTIKMQSKELKEAKEETRIANRIQDKQTAVFERQNFESVLFRLLDVHSRLAERIRTSTRLGEGDRFKLIVDNILDLVNERVLDRPDISELLTRMTWKQIESQRNKDYVLGMGKLVDAARQAISEEQKILLSQYFRNMYQILKLIDNFKLEVYDEGGDKSKKSKRQLRMEYFQRRQYCNILRAQLSDDELKVAYFNCLMPTGFGLRYYVEKYSLFKHMDRDSFLFVSWDWQRAYAETAYSDYELISDVHIRDFQRERSSSNFNHMFPR